MMQKYQLLQDRARLIVAIDLILQSILKETQNLREQRTAFHYQKQPSVDISGYLRRITSFTHCSNSVYIVALILLDRVCEYNENFFVTYGCIHRLIVVAIVVAAKSYDDFYFKNSYYAKVAGITNRQLNSLEIKFLEMLNYDISAPAQLFKAYEKRLRKFAYQKIDQTQQN